MQFVVPDLASVRTGKCDIFSCVRPGDGITDRGKDITELASVASLCHGSVNVIDQSELPALASHRCTVLPRTDALTVSALRRWQHRQTVVTADVIADFPKLL